MQLSFCQLALLLLRKVQCRQSGLQNWSLMYKMCLSSSRVDINSKVHGKRHSHNMYALRIHCVLRRRCDAFMRELSRSVRTTNSTAVSRLYGGGHPLPCPPLANAYHVTDCVQNLHYKTDIATSGDQVKFGAHVALDHGISRIKFSTNCTILPAKKMPANGTN